MERFKPIKGLGYIEQITFTLVVDAGLFALAYYATTYEFLNVVRLVILIFNAFQLYYILLHFTLKFSFDEYNLYIKGNWGLKSVVIPFDTIEKYFITKESIKGTKLSGHGTKHYAIGRTVLDRIGTTSMFVTSTKNIIYLKTANGNYAFSPLDINQFKEKFETNNLTMAEWEYTAPRNSGINKEKKFIILLCIASAIILFLIINPFIWYLKGSLPSTNLPLSFDGNFEPVKRGTAKQFLIKQTSYGLLNMAVLLCMYYAAYFSSKYDKKTAYRFIYASILLSIAFLLMQFRVLFYF